MKLPRLHTEEKEFQTLSKFASKSAESLGRKTPEPYDDIRTDYQRDRDRIVHCKAFRRLKHKTQVFLSPEGDHYRTRLTHTLEVAQIGRTIARALNLNEDLTEAIALGHDLGHTPFGHAGERALNRLSKNGFKHYLQSVRVCERLEKDGRGLNLTAEVLDGIACHTGGREAFTLEGRIIRLADKIAFINHDIEDAVTGGVLKETDIPGHLRKILGDTKSQRINSMVLSVINNSYDTIKMDAGTAAAFNEIYNFMFEKVYLNPVAKAEEKKVDGIIDGLYYHYMKSPDNLPEDYRIIAASDGLAAAVLDYIAGMTDPYATQKYIELYVPRSWHL